MGYWDDQDPELLRRNEQMRLDQSRASAPQPPQQSQTGQLWQNYMALPMGFAAKQALQLADLYQNPSKVLDYLPVVSTVKKGAKLTGDVIEGKVDPRSSQGIERVADVATDVVLDGGTVKVNPGEVALGSGRLDPKIKAMTDLRRQYQGKSPRTSVHEYENYQLGPDSQILQPVKDFDVNALRKGDMIFPVFGDRSRVSGPLTELQGKRLPAEVSAEGGPDYMRTPGGIWASGQSITTGLQNKVDEALQGGGRSFGVYSAMSPKAIDYSHHLWEPMLWQADKIPIETRKAFDEAMRKDVPQWPGLDKPEASAMLLADQTGTRKPFLKKALTKEWQAKGMPEPGPIRWAMTEPDLRSVAPHEMGYAWGEFTPGGKTTAGGAHPSYPTELHGTYAGRTPGLSWDAYLRDFAQRPDVASQEAANKLYTLRLNTPTQTVDQKLIDSLGRAIEARKRGS